MTQDTPDAIHVFPVERQ